MAKENCDHFWEIDFPVKDWNKPTWVCMHCGKEKKESIPILDIGKVAKRASEKRCDEMDYHEFKSWATQHVCDGFISGGFSEVSSKIHNIICQVLQNKVFGGAKKK